MTPAEARKLEPGQLLKIKTSACPILRNGSVVQFRRALYDAECVHVYGPGGQVVLLCADEVELPHSAK